MQRRTLLQAVATTALAIPFVARFARAAGKEIVYLTPGLNLPFWRYLSRGSFVATSVSTIKRPTRASRALFHWNHKLAPPSVTSPTPKSTVR